MQPTHARSSAARCRRALGVLALGVLGALPAQADTLRVPQDFETIAEALDAASSGDEIVISKGTYPAIQIDRASELTLRAKGKVFIQAPVSLAEGEGSSAALQISTSSQVEITGLRFADTPGAAVVAVDCSELTLSKLRIENAGSFGIQLTGCDDTLVFKARIDVTGDDGIRTDNCSGITVDKCLILDAGNDGVSLSSGGGVPTDSSFVLRTKILRPGDDGVDVNGDDNLVESVVVRDAQEDGFEVDFDGVGIDNVFRKCRALDPVEQGFELNGSSNTVEDSRVLRSGDDALVLGGTGGHMVVNNRVSRAGFDGVFVIPNAVGNTITDNIITKPQDDGIDIEGGESLVLRNRITKAANIGLEVESTGNTFTENKLKASGSLDISDTSGGPNTYTDNKFKTSNLP